MTIILGDVVTSVLIPIQTVYRLISAAEDGVTGKPESVKGADGKLTS